MSLVLATKHFYNPSQAQFLVFKAYFKGQKFKIEAFLALK